MGKSLLCPSAGRQLRVIGCYRPAGRSQQAFDVSKRLLNIHPDFRQTQNLSVLQIYLKMRSAKPGDLVRLEDRIEIY
jgi:hypothetical protein